MQFKNVDFTRNYISIYAPPYSLENSFGYDIDPDYNSNIEDCRFNGTHPILLPPYIGQRGIPQGQKPFSGMYFINLRRPNLGGSPYDRVFMIPLSRNAAYSTDFSDLHYGIYGVNSNMEVFNCTFSKIQPVSAYSPRRYSDAGCAIYTRVEVNSAVKFLKVGDQNDVGNGLNFENYFEDCRRGIITVNGVNSFINYNSFVHPSNTGNPSSTGIYIKDADLRQISIRNNTFEEEKYRPVGPYPSTGIVVSSIIPTYKNLHIADNTFVNERVGVYLQNSRGRRYSDQNFVVADNLFVININPGELASYHGIFGIWMNNVSMGMVRYNQFYRPTPLSQEPANFQTMVYGMNIVGSTDMNIAGNDFTQFGTSMRMVSNCAGTTLKCNTMTANVQGISLAMASMTAQGWPGEAWDNKWDGFPYASSTTYNRAHGTSPYPIKWYNQGQANDAGNYNRFSPEPVDFQIIDPYPLQQSPGCYLPSPNNGDVEGRNDRISKIIEGEIEYVSFPEETKYLDQEFVYQAMAEDSLLRQLDINYQEYYDSLEQSEFGQFTDVDEYYLDGKVVDALRELGLIIESSSIEHNKIFTREVFLTQKESGNEEFEEEVEEELHQIAWTNAWEGGSGVFGARHLLEEQVFDLERNLRVSGPAKNTETVSSPVQFSIYPNPASESVTLFHTAGDDASVSVKVYDLQGRIVIENAMQGNKLNIQNLNQGIYILHLYVNQEFYSKVKLTVLN